MIVLSKEDIQNFQNIIGYQFHDIDYMKRALTHSSYANEKRIKKIESNERLEFLGDAVLELISSQFIFENYPKMQEGEMTKLRASLVCEPTLAYSAREIGLGEYMMLGKGEEMTGGRERDSILSDAMEALIGAIYLDGGFTNAKEFICRFILSDIDKKQLFFDSKTILQEIIQGKSLGELSYSLIDEKGPDHNKCFTVTANIDGVAYETGEGRTKKAAEQNAAYKTILRLKKEKRID